MSVRRVWLAVIAMAVLFAGMAGLAAPASAATTTPDTVTVTYTSSLVVTPTSLAGSADDTFTFVNDRDNDNGLSYVSIVNAGGSVSVGGTSCTTETTCKVYDKTSLPRNTVTVTVTTPGTTTIRRFADDHVGGGTWSTVGTLTISGGSGSSGGVTDPALVYPTVTFDAIGG